MITVRRTDSSDPRFQDLVHRLDRYLAGVDGDAHDFFHQFNKIDTLRHVVVVSVEGAPAGCGAIRAFDDERIEVKRMFVDPAFRRRGVAQRILAELEAWSRELGFRACILETGQKMTDAVALYRGAGYEVTPNYGQYEGVAASVCFAKRLM